MNTWFLVKVKYTKQIENGTFKRVSEPYLVAAMSFTDAEARIYEELGSVIRGEFVVLSIQRFDVADLFHYEDSESWYKCRVTYLSQDADSEKTKKVKQNFLITANSAKEAYERIKSELSTLMVSFTIPLISLTDIVDVFPYSEENN